jgi:hypothetical protein
MPIVIGNGITLGSGVNVTIPPPGGSIELGSSSSYIGTTSITALGSSPGTYEFWFYPTPGNGVLWNTRAGGTSSFGGFSFSVSSNAYNLVTGITTAFFAAGTVTLNAWNHVAITFTSGTNNSTGNRLWVNGALVITFQNRASLSSTELYIGGIPSGGFVGYFSNFRYVRGVQVYTGTFTPPTSLLTATQSAGTNISAITAGQTQLLLNTENSGTYLTDTSGYGRTITTGGSVSFNSATPF